MTFNVLHGQAMTGGRPVAFGVGEAAGEPLGAAVAALDADVVALQEVDRAQERSGRIDQARVAADAMGAAHWRFASAVHGRSVPGEGWVLDPKAPDLRVYGPPGAGAGAGAGADTDTDTDAGAAGGVEAYGDAPAHGVALLTRLPVRHWRARRLAPAPFALPLRVAGRPGLVWVRDQPRAVLAAVLEGNAGPFTAVALHLSFVPGWNARQLAAVRRWIADLPRPYLLLGDFNLTGAVPRTVLAATGRERWHDLARTPTYPAHRPLVQFDHILAHGVPPSSVRPALTSATAPLTPLSDHRPLVADVQW
ncbi:endonuclease/exonuclease/phosphatase family protein [Streptomyces sp. NPDC087422]|uniref:endonuclease/exonuclease/phosphatase family protein n=1 Tax=Streptomyces sp. NPDC087422 TaxID=3365786 RepID=UPI00382D2F04